MTPTYGMPYCLTYRDSAILTLQTMQQTVRESLAAGTAQRLNLFLPPDLIRRIKTTAIERRTTVSKWAEQVFKAALRGAK
jgi:hypothetical protein